MKIKTIELQPKPYTLYFLGDIHLGAANHQSEAFRKAVDMIAADGDAWLGLGDYCDCIDHLDPRFNPREIDSTYTIRDLDNLVAVQFRNLLDELEPIKDRCIGLISGNHEDKFREKRNYDANREMAAALGTDDLGHKAWISLSFRYNENKSIPFKLVAVHGTGNGGGKREGTPTNVAHDVFRWDMADFHIMGHLHQAAVSRAQYNRFEYGTVRREPAWFCVNGCFLSKSEIGNDGYFEQRSGMESSIGVIKLTITPHQTSKDRFTSQAQMIWL